MLLFLIWKCIDVLVSLLAPQYIPYLGFFSYGKDMLQYNMPDAVRALSNFDGIFFIRIALQGYSHTEQAYFPLYPILIRYLNIVVQNPILTGVLISHVAFALGAFVFRGYIRSLRLEKYTWWIFSFLFAYPTSYYFGVMYTESVFFLLFVSSLYFFTKQRLFLAAACAYLTALTRVVGVFVIVPMIFTLLGFMLKSRPLNLRRVFTRYWKNILVCLVPLLGFATYCAYLYITTGDALYFFHAQESFGAQRSSRLVIPAQVLFRYVKIFVTADKNFQYYVAVLEFCFYVFAICVLAYDLRKLLLQKKRRLDRIGLNIFSWINVILPSLTGTLTAIPRYTLLSLSIFIALAEMKNTLYKYLLLLLFTILHIMLYAFFVQGYYVT